MSHSIRHINNGETSYDLYQVACHSDPDTDPCYVSCTHLDNGSIGHPSTGCMDPGTCSSSYRTDYCVWTNSLEANAEEGLDYSYIGNTVNNDDPYPSGNICIIWVEGFGFGWHYLEEEPEVLQGFQEVDESGVPVSIPVPYIGRMVVELSDIKDRYHSLVKSLEELITNTSGYVTSETVDLILPRHRKP